MNNSRENISSLREELQNKDSSWRSIQVEWAPSYKDFPKPQKYDAVKSTYMDHVMADSLNVPVTRSRCLFSAAISQMIPACDQNLIDAEPHDVLGIPEGEKFSLDPAGLNSEDISARNLPEFSKFLLHLAGENELCIVADPLRDIEKFDVNFVTSQVRNDKVL